MSVLFLLCIYLKVEYCVPWTRHLTELIWLPNTLSWILLWGLSFPWKCFYNLVVVKEMIREYCKQTLGYGDVAHLCSELNHQNMSFPWCWGEWLFSPPLLTSPVSSKTNLGAQCNETKCSRPCIGGSGTWLEVLNFSHNPAEVIHVLHLLLWHK